MSATLLTAPPRHSRRSQPRPVARLEPDALDEFSPFGVALVVSAQQDDGGDDFQLLADACRKQGIELRACRWDVQQDWTVYDALIPLRVWDYVDRLSSFRHWLHEREQENALIINDAQTIRWNMDKSYLIDLAEHGIPITATQIRPAACRTAGIWPLDTTLVVKPRYGAGGRDVKLLENAGDWRTSGRDWLVQAYQSSVAERGEISIICIDGEPRAALRRRPAQFELCVEEHVGATVCELTPGFCEFARHVLDATQTTPLYARVDLWDLPDEDWQLGEIELFEPDLYLRLLPALADEFAQALHRRLTSPTYLTTETT